jgi:hypothetical protein
MIPVPSDVRIWIAMGRTDMRRGMRGLALQVQQTLKRDPHAGDIYVFRGRAGSLVKILWHDDLLPRNHTIGKLARQMETSDAAKPIYRGSDHWCVARA